jgi:hypothetical protein
MDVELIHYGLKDSLPSHSPALSIRATEAGVIEVDAILRTDVMNHADVGMLLPREPLLAYSRASYHIAATRAPRASMP